MPSSAFADLCQQREVLRSLRGDMRSEAALAALEGLEAQATTHTESAAIRLDRADVLLDLWNVPLAQMEIALASAELEQSSADDPPACGASPSEELIRLLELPARASRVKGDYELAVAQWTIALRERRAQPDLQPASLARSLSLAAEAFWLFGDFDTMESLYAEATDIAESLEPPDDLLHARIVMGTGLMAAERGDLIRAEAAYARSLDIYRRAGGDSHPALAGLWLSIGALAANRNDLLTADGAYQRVAAILEPLTDRSLAWDRATLSLNLGLMDARLGRVEEPRLKLEAAHQLWTENGGANHPHLAWVNESLSDLLAAAGRLDEADAALAFAVRQRQRSMPGSPVAVLTAARLATLRAKEGKANEARGLWREIDAGAPDPRRSVGFFQANLAARRAETAEALGDLATAARLRADVEAHFRRQLPDGHPGFAEIRGQRARLAWQRGLRAQALRLATSAWQIQRRVVSDTITTLPETDALRFVDRSRDLRDLLLCVAATAPSGPGASAATDGLMRDLAASRALIASAGSARARAGDSDEMAAARRRYASLLWQPVSTIEADYVETLATARRQLEELERKAARGGTAPSLAGQPAEPDAWSFLSSGDALVTFGRYRCPASDTAREAPRPAATGYVAFVRTADRPARMVRFADGDRLDRAVADWHETLAGAVYAPPTEAQDEELDERGRVLSNLLWAPLAAAIGTSKRVLIVPDGTLHSVSWYALPTASGKYLIDGQRLIHVLTTETDLRPPAAEDGTEERPVVLLADPLVARASTAVAEVALGAEARQLRSACRFLDPQRIPRLDEARDEARDIEAQVKAAHRSVELTIGVDASESWLRAHAPRASILHLAAHGGLLSPDSCREPAGDARETERARMIWETAVRARPLMRSGLLLTGAAGYTPLDAPGTDDDGILVAEEAARLDLRGADWVVLSACSTRRGPVVDAEGALGLHRAFHSAGARTVIASLWDVQDAPARRFMSALYSARLRDGKSTAEAMRDAQRAVLNELRASGRSTHPVQWAAFVASGDWR